MASILVLYGEFALVSLKHLFRFSITILTFIIIIIVFVIIVFVVIIGIIVIIPIVTSAKIPEVIEIEVVSPRLASTPTMEIVSFTTGSKTAALAT